MSDELTTHGSVALCSSARCPSIERLLERYGLHFNLSIEADAIPGSYWGTPEAGLIGRTVHASPATPVHSVLHETCHLLCMTEQRRVALHTNAGGDTNEENAVCFLSILLASTIDEFGRERMFHDMDAWGYSFRLGSVRAWFSDDAEDAREWLTAQALIDAQCRPTWQLRG
jgi:hypothetical protein